MAVVSNEDEKTNQKAAKALILTSLVSVQSIKAEIAPSVPRLC